MSPPSAVVWDPVNADSSLCSRKSAILTIVSTGARAHVECANLVIVNHSLLFSLLGAGFGQMTMRVEYFFR